MRLENKRLRSSKIIKTKKPKVLMGFVNLFCIRNKAFCHICTLTVPVDKHAKINNLGQYPVVLPSQLVSNPYILLKFQERRQLMQFYTITKLYYQDLN